MLWTLAGLAALACLWLGLAGYLASSRGISYRQAILYAPLKLAFLIRDDRLPPFEKARGTIYVVSHRSRLDPALMLALLPDDTLHILDHDSATAWWMEPFRELARTIAFNATHVFVSRRLVRILRGNGRIAVYLPDDVEPDTRGFRLYRAVARIAAKADAAVVTIRVGNPGRALSDRSVTGKVTAWPRPPLTFGVLSPVTIAELRARIGEGSITVSNALFDRIAQTSIGDVDHLGSTFNAVAVARRFGDEYPAVLDGPGRTLSHRDLMVTARLLAARLVARTQPGDAIGLILPQSRHLVPAFLAAQSAGVVAAIFDTRHDAEMIGKAVRGAAIRKILTSREASGSTLATAEATGARLYYVEDILEAAGPLSRAMAVLMRNRALARPGLDDRAAMIVSSEDRNARIDILSHRRLLIAAAQAGARLRVAEADAMVSAIPPSEATGLALGLLLPLATGTPLRIGDIASPLPDVSGDGPTIVLTTASQADELLSVADTDGSRKLRAVIVLDTPFKAGLDRELMRNGVEVLEAWAPPGIADIASLSSSSHRRAGTAGRLLPAFCARLEPVDGLERGGRLLLSGAGTMSGWLDLDEAGRFEAFADGWIDTGMLVVLDREGFVTSLGAANDYAFIEGVSVPIGPCEAMAASLWPDALHAALALPDRRKGERIVLVTTEVGADKASLRKLAKSLGIGERVLASDILAVEEMPPGADGAPDREALRAVARARLTRSNARAA